MGRRGECRVEGNPQVSDVGDLGNSVVGVCRGERRRKWREGPDGEKCTFFWVDWKAISPPRLRRKKVRIEGDLIGIVDTPFSRHLQKGKQNHRERRVDHLYITEKVMGQ